MAGFQNWVATKADKDRRLQDRRAAKEEKLAAKVRERKLRRLAEANGNATEMHRRAIRDP
jgi:hypothetical protein